MSVKLKVKLNQALGLEVGGVLRAFEADKVYEFEPSEAMDILAANFGEQVDDSENAEKLPKPFSPEPTVPAPAAPAAPATVPTTDKGASK